MEERELFSGMEQAEVQLQISPIGTPTIMSLTNPEMKTMHTLPHQELAYPVLGMIYQTRETQAETINPRVIS